MTAKLKRNLTKVKDPGSALTHFIAMILAMIAAMPLLMKAVRDSGHLHVSALAIFILSMIGLYAASTIYHTLDISPQINQMLRKIDHMMIFILIAGTYTPVCMIRPGRQDRLVPSDPCLGYCHCGYPYQCPVDYLPKMVLFPDLYCHGLGMRPGHHQNTEFHAKSRLPVAAGRRCHIHGGRHHLRPEASVL